MDEFDPTDLPEFRKLTATRRAIRKALDEIWSKPGLDFDQKSWADGLVFRTELERRGKSEADGASGGRPSVVSEETKEAILRAYGSKRPSWTDNQFIEAQAGALGLSPSTVRRVLKSSLSKGGF
jgi:hypothetical protein